MLPAIKEFEATWLIVSAGFDAHRRDPLTGLALSSGDYADITATIVGAVPPGRRLVFLEGGYDLQALADSTAATLGVLEGIEHHPERPTSGWSGLSRWSARSSGSGPRSRPTHATEAEVSRLTPSRPILL